MKYPIRYFSIGLFTASLILLVGYYFFEPKETLSEEGPIDDIITNIEKEGYRVISESEYISLATAKNELNSLQLEEEQSADKETDEKNKDDDKKEKKEKSNSKKTNNKKDDDKDKKSDQKKDKKKKDDKDNKKKKKKKNKAKTYTLVVEENMVISNVSQKLEENKIIKDAAKFNKFMEDNDYSPYLQIGEFKLKSDMTHEEIAKAITNR